MNEWLLPGTICKLQQFEHYTSLNYYIKLHLWFFLFAKRFGLAFDGIDMAESSAVDDDLTGLKIVAGAESMPNLHWGDLLVCEYS